MSTAPEKRRLTPAEYLAREKAAPTKSEFYRGEIFAMAGASIRHNVITGNLYFLLRTALRGKDCRPFGSDLRITAKPLRFYTYPDVSVVCGPLEFDDLDPDTVTNPRIIVEVLSKSTENYDRGQKFEFYQRIDAFEEYILLSQDEPKLVQYSRCEDGSWRYKLVSGLDQFLDIEAVGSRLRLADIYDGVKFGSGDETNSAATA